MRPVKDFCGNWNPERRAIQFKWDVSGMENDRFIYIVGLQEADGRWKPDLSKQHLFDICDMKNISQSSTFMPIASLGVGVYKMRFCAFSMPQATAYSDEDIQNACASDPAFTTEVMLGRANVVYVAESTVAENAKIVRLHMRQIQHKRNHRRYQNLDILRHMIDRIRMIYAS